jgi:hypothetical protein
VMMTVDWAGPARRPGRGGGCAPARAAHIANRRRTDMGGGRSGRHHR